MNRPVELKVKTRPQLALESYLDALLQEATAEDLPEPILALEPVVEAPSTLDEFQLAVLEEQARDAQVVVPTIAPVVVAPVVVEPVVEVHMPPSITPPPVTGDGRPAWAAEPFECLLFDVAGLTLAVPLVCLGSIYSLEGQELTPLFGQPEWFLGILPSQAGNLKVLDTARWVMPDRYRDDFRQGLQYVISVQGYEWGLAVHQVSRSLRLDPNEIKWRSHRGQRPWLAGTVIEHMCALLDVAELAELIASGAVKSMPGQQRS
ncbi:chemotaxis protein CheW [Pseudomonas sp. LY-1]|uniref:CheW domain-containing protein n=1 Tax=Pseudomonas veronii TaxID=76761 RepID=A0ABS0VFI6_PSEVE|nr:MULTISPECIES: CheW domain-containing protein [Pseudomonas fluorescens group]MBI6550981.1 CheW domain-containing protein [Pseudomonas veronii]MBI6649889.1 CheW domain-containing protein [Pseudomonas veronii]MCP1507997.1 purine-binding chemotaxis protein CheW [Pseudomonas marginalis]MCP1525501.1 purine-binding chemotaxis protein CheW [Pseudomonas marginalis]MDQ0499185.1 purine-binding chemotaxis protein CheW [Pseudomonas marginalis]